MLVESVPFTRTCWHTVDPGTVLFTGSLNENVGCSGTWLAEHEYVIEDVNKWWFLARSGRLAGATSIATHGELTRSARHRSQSAYGIGDELRGAFVADGIYWGAAGLLREAGTPWFTVAEERFLASVSEPVARGIRRTMLATAVDAVADAPGVVLFDADGAAESVSPGAEQWIAQVVEEPPPRRRPSPRRCRRSRPGPARSAVATTRSASPPAPGCGPAAANGCSSTARRCPVGTADAWP